MSHRPPSVRLPLDSPRPRPLLAALGTIAAIWAAGHGTPAAAELVTFDVDPAASSFATDDILVEFTAVAQTSIGPQITHGDASVENVTWAPDGHVSLDLETATVSLEDLDVTGEVGISGSGEMVWARLVTLDLIYTILEQGLHLPAPLSMPLDGGSFSGTPPLEFTGVAEGTATGPFGYSMPPQEFGGTSGLPLSGSVTSQGSDLALAIDATAAQIELGGGPPVSTPLNECVGFWFFTACIGVRITAIEITVEALTYNNTVMHLAGLAVDQSTPICGNGVVEAGEECDDGNLWNGDGCSDTCQSEAVCGNDVLEEGEECDDGNLENGDGCSDTCQSEAVCGNGVVEDTELCDDGNLLDGDGCSAICKFEFSGDVVPSLSGWGLALLSGALVLAGLLAAQRFTARKT